MITNSVNNIIIAKNSFFLYFRSLVIMITTLFTSRVILQSLGVEDYGIYNVVAGVVLMFNVILGSMTDATQRFLTIELGKGDTSRLNKVFSTSLLLHIIIGVLIVIIAEPIGLWFLYNKLIIPGARLTAALWVFQCSLVSLFVLVISIPYNALIVAHEKMKAFAYISLLDSFLRLSIAYLIFLNFGVDKLIFYAILMMSSQILLRNIYNVYCRRNFNESKYIYTKDIALVKDIGKFAMWSLFGNLSFVCSNYGVSLLLGTFYSPFVNAARGIAIQVQGAFNTFVKNFQIAVNPQITKNYAIGNIEEMSMLVFRSARLSFLLILIPIIPIFFEVENVLVIWLTNVPEYTVSFVRLMIVSTLISTLRYPLEVAAKATGRIKKYEFYVYGSNLLILPSSYICLKIGAGPVSVFVVTIVFEVVAVLISLIETKRLIGISIMSYTKNVLVRVVSTVLISLCVPLLIVSLIEQNMHRTYLLLLLTIVSTTICAYILGLTQEERNSLVVFLKSKIIKSV